MVLTNDTAARAIMANLDVIVSLNTKFQLFITNKNVEKPKEELQLQGEHQG